MRFLRVVIVSVLILSLVLNVVLYTKYRTKRSIITVNGEGITKKDIDDYLEQQAGPNVKAQMVQRRMIFQEATKLGVLPTDAEVEDEFNTQKEISWQFAREISGNPWAAGEAKNRIRQQIAQLRIMTKEVPVSDEEIKDTYKQNAMRFDTPNKAKAHLAIVINAGQANEIKQLMQKTDPPISPTVIMQNFRGAVVFIGNENTFTFTQAYGTTQNKAIFDMKPNQVLQVPPGEFAKMGAKAIFVRLTKIEPGKKADLKDKKTKERIQLQVAAQRAKPWQEHLSKLWSSSKIDTENPQDKKYIETIFFPDRQQK